MKKKLVLCIVVIIIIGLSGCKKTPTKDLYGDAQIESTEQNTQVSEELAEENAVSEEESDTVIEDVYGDDNQPVEVEESDLQDIVVTAELVTDEDFRDKVLNYIEKFYYNLYFGKSNLENGIEESDMTKFAIYYIYQNEYHELKFNTSLFVLYVPDKRVEELVRKYFDKNVTGHHTFEEEGIVYEDGYYLMPAVNTGWSESVVLDDISVAGDFAYEVAFSVHNEEGAVIEKYKAMLEVREGRFVLGSYYPTEEINADDSEAETEADNSEAEVE